MHMLMIIHPEIHSPEGQGEFPAGSGGTGLGDSRGASQLTDSLLCTWLALGCVESWGLFKQ